jgi:hypothetical protein
MKIEIKTLLWGMLVLPLLGIGQNNVGIGTNFPSRRLHVISSSALPMRVESLSTTDSEIEFATSEGNVGYVGSYLTSIELMAAGSKRLVLGTSLAPRIIITPSGNVGIGTSVPATLLHTNGSVSITGNNFLEFGQGIGGKEVNAGKVGYALFTPNTLDIVGAGNGFNRRIRLWAEELTEMTGSASVNGSLTVGGPLSFAGANPAAFVLNVSLGSNTYTETYVLTSVEADAKLVRINHPASNFNPNAIILCTGRGRSPFVSVEYRSADGYWYLTVAGRYKVSSPMGIRWNLCTGGCDNDSRRLLTGSSESFYFDSYNLLIIKQ